MSLQIQRGKEPSEPQIQFTALGSWDDCFTSSEVVNLGMSLPLLRNMKDRAPILIHIPDRSNRSDGRRN